MTRDEILHEGEFLRLRRHQHWEYVERANARGAVLIVAVTDAGELLLVEQPRLPVGASVVELPAGLVGDLDDARDESLAVAAYRELEEETGYAAQEMTFLTAGPPTAGLANEQIAFYLAGGLRKTGEGGGDASERITPHAVPLTEVHAWLHQREAEGLLVDPKVYAGLYFAERANRSATGR